MAVAAAAVVAGATCAWLFWKQHRVYTTAVSEQRTLRLSDGSHVTLNTGSRMAEEFSASTRQIRLEKGELFVEVARDPARPFRVVAGEQVVTALGTSFSVRLDPDSVAVTLLDGKVAVSDVGELSPGERVTIQPQAARNRSAPSPSSYQIDTPRVEAVTAWRRGEVVFEKTPLLEAIGEMNRYDERHLEIDDSVARYVRITGIYRPGDNEGFAQAIARIYGLRVETHSDQIILTSGGAH
jgi:transmembrane sensor